MSDHRDLAQRLRNLAAQLEDDLAGTEHDLTLTAAADVLDAAEQAEQGWKDELQRQVLLKNDYLKAADRWSERAEKAEAALAQEQRQVYEAGWTDGFFCSGEGWNGEYPFRSEQREGLPPDDPRLKELENYKQHCVTRYRQRQREGT